ncbi:MAG TPA: FtsW/RodA/SpoVE family cell cycle protein [Ktedonobacterales bacterium]|jgi:cell division protein FtsW (lipid II flippase)
MIRRSRYRWTELFLLLLPAAFLLLGTTELLVLKTQPAVIDRNNLPTVAALLPALGLIAALAGTHIVLCWIAPDSDQTLLPIAGTLASLGVLMATRLGPDLGQPDLGSKQLGWVVVGLVACLITVFFTRSLRWLRLYKYTWAAAGLALVAVALAHARTVDFNTPGRDTLGIGPGSFQPSELLKICLVIFFAAYLSENREILTQGGYRLGPFTLPPPKQLGPLLVMLGISLLIFVGLRELGLALLIFGLFLSLLWVASGKLSYVVGSLVLFAGGAFIAYKLFSYVRDRVAVVFNAFDQNLAHTTGYQIVQGLIAFGVGGVFGQGLGQGAPWIVPAVSTDYIASAIGEELGLVGLLAVICLFLLLLYRGARIALLSRDSFNQLLAIGLTAVFAIQSLVILAGNLKVMPLTGIPLPFLSYGGSSVIANFIIIGLLLRLSTDGSVARQRTELPPLLAKILEARERRQRKPTQKITIPAGAGEP